MPYIRNKRTGETKWVPDEAGAPQMPADPTFPYKGQQAQVGIQAQQSNIASDATNRARQQQQMAQSGELFGAQKRAAEAEALMKEMQAAAARAEMEAKSPLNPQQIQSAKTDAMSKLQTIDRIRANDRNSWLPTIGLGAETAAGIGGTGAANIATDLDTLKSGSALSEVLKMTQATGKNPFTPMSNSDVQLIANNVGNLSQRQDRPNFMANLDNYENAYRNAYVGAVGKETLDAEIARLLPTIPPAKREAFRADAMRRYNEKMTAPRPPKRKTWWDKPTNAPRKQTQSKVIDYSELPD